LFKAQTDMRQQRGFTLIELMVTLAVLAIVLVNEDDTTEGPYYIRRPFDREPGWGVSSINYSLDTLLTQATTSPM
jgi:prepilin-type N-terminal cleavage/methylation domain-containing protein